VRVQIRTCPPSYKRLITIQKFEHLEEDEPFKEDSTEYNSEPVGRCEICKGYGITYTFRNMNSCEDAHSIFM
jgi:hypothetical protein